MRPRLEPWGMKITGNYYMQRAVAVSHWEA